MAIYREAHLFFKDHRSNKEYHLTLERNSTHELYKVIAKFGPRGGTLTHVDKTHGYTTYDKAVAIYDKTYAEKTGKGYKPFNDLAQRIQRQVGISSWILTDNQWQRLTEFIEMYAEECA